MPLSWPTPEDVLAQLPLDSFESEETASKGVSRENVLSYLADWQHKLKQGSQSDPTLTPIGASLVLRGARADALEQLYVVQGSDVPRAVETLRREAYRMLQSYENEVSLPGESQDDPVDSQNNEDGEVLNFTEDPMWNFREYPSSGTPESGSERGSERGRWMYG